MSNGLSWHQLAAARRTIALRHVTAHFIGPQAGYRTLCNQRVHVYVDPEHKDNPNNEPICKRCRELHEKQEAVTDTGVKPWSHWHDNWRLTRTGW